MTEVLLVVYGLVALFFFGYLMPTAKERAAVKSRSRLVYAFAASVVLALVWPISFAVAAGLAAQGDGREATKE